MLRLVQRIVAVLLMPHGYGAYAQADYPNRPVKVVIGFPAGGPTDIVGRPFAARLSQLTGQQFIIENRAGANGVLAAEYVSKSAADGYIKTFRCFCAMSMGAGAKSSARRAFGRIEAAPLQSVTLAFQISRIPRPLQWGAGERKAFGSRNSFLAAASSLDLSIEGGGTLLNCS